MQKSIVHNGVHGLVEPREPYRLHCPLCGAELVPLQANSRCSRCGLVLCEACEGEGEHVDDGP
jgi:hypothetical protein